MTNPRARYQVDLPPSVERAVFQTVRQYTALHPIGRAKLVEAVNSFGHPADERQVREAIKMLRRNGYLICAAAGTGGGYYLAHSYEDYEGFRQRELAAKISDMAETMRAMDATARERFGDGVQIGLF